MCNTLCILFLFGVPLFVFVCVVQRRLWRTLCSRTRQPTSPSPSLACLIPSTSCSPWAAATRPPMTSWTASSRLSVGTYGAQPYSHGCIMRTGFWTKRGSYSLDWKLLAWCINQKDFLASGFAFALCGPLHMCSSVSVAAPSAHSCLLHRIYIAVMT